MIITIIIIIIRRRRRRIVFMLLSSWCVKSHCQSSSGSFDWCRLSAKWTPNTNHHNKSTNFGYETHGPTKEGARLSRPIIRPQCMHSVHKMRPIATYGVAWSVCLCACMSVCRSRSWALQKSWTDLDAVWETDSGVSKDLLDWRLDPQREWAILGVVRPIEKHWESWLRCTQKNGWTDRDAIWADLCGPKKVSTYLMGIKIGRIHSPPRGVTRCRCGLSSAKFFDHFFITDPHNGPVLFCSLSSVVCRL